MFNIQWNPTNNDRPFIRTKFSWPDGGHINIVPLYLKTVLISLIEEVVNGPPNNTCLTDC